MEDPEYSHRPLSGVLQAVLGERRQMHRRPWANQRFLSAEVKNSFPIDYIDDLVVGMAVGRCAARWDHPDELRHVEAADVLVHEVTELTAGSSLESRLVGVPHRAARWIDGRGLLRCRDADDHELSRARILDLVGLAGDDVRTHVRRERVLISAHEERAPAGLDVEELLDAVKAARLGAAGSEAQHALFEVLGPVPAVDRDLYRERVDRSITSWTCEGMSSTRQTS
jgi:hypothetical protein